MDKRETRKSNVAPTTSTVKRERTTNFQQRLGLKFENIVLNRNLRRGLFAKSFKEPTRVQEETIQQIHMGNSVFIRSEHNTGKTASYLICLINMVTVSIPHIQALVLVPTKELVIETLDDAKELAKYMDCVYFVGFHGNYPVRKDIENIEKNKPLIAISTIQRFAHLLNTKKLNPEFIRYLVLDEADHLFLNDKKDALQNIMKVLKTPQIIMISNSLLSDVFCFQEKYMDDAIEVTLMNNFTLTGISQFYVCLEEEHKLICLDALFQQLKVKQCIIFCNSVETVDMVWKYLDRFDFPVVALHEKTPHNERTDVFKNFEKGNSKYLVSSDLGSRNIDVKNVNVVINFDMPTNPDTYLRRVGRSEPHKTTAIAISLLTYVNYTYWDYIETELKTIIEPLPRKIRDSLYVS